MSDSQKEPSHSHKELNHSSNDPSPRYTRLMSCYVKVESESDDQMERGSMMLCEMIGEEIQTVSLRVASDAMTRSISL